MKTRYYIYIALGTVWLTALFTNIENINLVKFYLVLLVLCIVVCLIIETLFYIAERNFIEIKRDIYPNKIEISNTGYEVAEGCFAKVSKLYVLGSNHICQQITDENLDEVLQWDDNSRIVKIPKGNHAVLNVFDATEETIVFLFQDNRHLPFLIYKDPRYGMNARKGKYQIEIILFGSGKTNGGTDSIKRKSYWEIYYQSKGDGNLPTFEMRQIKKMKKPNGKVMDEQFPNSVSFDLYLKQ